jgi:homogentisate 1,2-dioxygenase
MGAFLFQLELPEFDESLFAVIPVHRALINKLFSEGRILSYSVADNRSMIWCVINAEDEQEAMELVLKFPLYQFFTDVSCHPLLFHNNQPAMMPTISLN